MSLLFFSTIFNFVSVNWRNKSEWFIYFLEFPMVQCAIPAGYIIQLPKQWETIILFNSIEKWWFRQTTRIIFVFLFIPSNYYCFFKSNSKHWQNENWIIRKSTEPIFFPHISLSWCVQFFFEKYSGRRQVSLWWKNTHLHRTHHLCIVIRIVCG